MFFPSWAQAEEATGPVYESEVPTVPSKESSPPVHHKHSGGSKGGSEEGEASKSGSPTNGGPGSGGSSKGGGNNTGQGSQGPNGEGGQNGGGSRHADQGVQKAKPINTLGEPAGHSEEEGSSSPLVPILIAIVVLAAISIGAFYYRQRRQGSGSPDSPASPKAS
jgi:hypothetical protein